MALNPELAQKLMAEFPELQDFCAHVNEEVAKLETFDGLEKIDGMRARGEEVTARFRAKEILQAILAPLIPTTPLKGRNLSEEYGVE